MKSTKDKPDGKLCYLVGKEGSGLWSQTFWVRISALSFTKSDFGLLIPLFSHQ